VCVKISAFLAARETIRALALLLGRKLATAQFYLQRYVATSPLFLSFSRFVISTVGYRL